MTMFDEVKQATFEACLKVICDKGLTPYVEVNTCHPEYTGIRMFESERGTTVFNISGKSIVNYDLNEKGVFFGTSFKGRHENIYIPWKALTRIWAKENVNLLQDFAFDVTGNSKIRSVENPSNHTQDVKPDRKPFNPKIVK